MQVSSAVSTSASSLAMFGRQAPATAEPNDQPAAKAIEAPPAAANDATTVTLHDPTQRLAAADETTAPRMPPEVFAEIWKDGMKIGTVYTNGQAVMPAAFDGIDSGRQGALYAYQRAEELSQRFGGEVRIVNLPALRVEQTRERLRTAYGA